MDTTHEESFDELGLDDPEALGEFSELVYSPDVPVSGLRVELDRDELTAAQEELANLMEEPPGGDNHGRAKPMGDAATSERPRPVELGVEGAVRTDFLRRGGWSIKNPPPTGRPAGRPKVWPGGVPDDAEAVGELLGFTPDELDRLTRQGPKTPELLAARDRLAVLVALLLDRGRGLGMEELLCSVLRIKRTALYSLAARGRNLKADGNP